MKVYALAIIVLFCIVEITTARWQDDVKINHWQQINTIINRQIGRIRADAAAKGTPAAERCSEAARQELSFISSRGYNDVSSCIRSADTAGIASVCCQQVDSRVFEEALGVSRTANECLSNA